MVEFDPLPQLAIYLGARLPKGPMLASVAREHDESRQDALS